MTSFLFTGRLMHSRRTPARNTFTYPVFNVLLDLDDLPALARRVSFLGYNRLNLVSVYDRDHFGAPGQSLRANLEAFLRSRGVEPPGGRVFLLANPRILGYVFNPVSFYYCYTLAGELACVVAEVNNTFGERHIYLLDGRNTLPGGRPGERRYGADKRLYVSPFIEMDARYEFTFSPLPSNVTGDPVGPTAPDDSLFVQIDEFRQGDKFFQARLFGLTQPLTARSLLAALFRYPLMTLQVIGLIHWQALRLHRLGLPWVPKPGTAPAPTASLNAKTTR